MIKQFLNLKLSQKLSPQQIQLMKLIQLPTQAFEQRLLEEMNENPALETGTEDNYEADEFENEDFERAVEIRDQIRTMETNQETTTKLEEELKQTILDHNFERSIEIRDELKKLKL